MQGVLIFLGWNKFSHDSKCKKKKKVNEDESVGVFIKIRLLDHLHEVYLKYLFC